MGNWEVSGGWGVGAGGGGGGADPNTVLHEGNAFGEVMVVGTTDAFDFEIINTGETAARFHRAAANVHQLLLDDGGASTPALAFILAEDTGVFLADVDQLDFVAASNSVLRMHANGGNPQARALADGTSANPFWTFQGDPTAGHYYDSGMVVTAASGTYVLYASDGEVGIQSSVNTNHVFVVRKAGTLAVAAAVLQVDNLNGRMRIGSTGALNPAVTLHVGDAETATNTIVELFRMQRLGASSPGAGLGAAQTIYIQDSVTSVEAFRLAVSASDAAAATFSAVVALSSRINGTTAERLRLVETVEAGGVFDLIPTNDGEGNLGETTTPKRWRSLAVSGDAYVGGKLTVVGAIDPTSVTLSGGGTAHFMQFAAGSTAAVSGAGTMRFRYDEAGNKAQVSLNGAAYVDISTGGGTFFAQGGNTFGANGVLGTNDAFDLEIRTGGIPALYLDTAQSAIFTNSVSIANGFLEVPDGTAGQPTVVGSGDQTTGILFSAGSGVRISHGGSLVASFNNTPAIFMEGDGSASDPTYSWNSSGNYGMYVSPGSYVGISAAGTEAVRFSTTGAVLHTSGSATNPGMAFIADVNWGWYFTPGTPSMSLSVDGTQALEFTNGVFIHYGNSVYEAVDQTGVGVGAVGRGRIRYNSTSGTFQISAEGGAYADIATGTSGWTDDGTVVRLTTAGDKVTIGGASNLAKFAVDGAADEIQLLVQGNATQTANLVVWENSAGSDLFRFSGAGAITMLSTGGISLRPTIDAATPDILIGSTGITFGGDVNISRGAADRLDIASGNRLRFASGGTAAAPRVEMGAGGPNGIFSPNAGEIAIGTNSTERFVVSNTDIHTRDIPFLPRVDAQAATTIGSTSLRFVSSAVNTMNSFAASGDANPTAQIASNSIKLGVNSADNLSVALSAGAANRLDLASGDSLNLVSGSLLIGATSRLSSVSSTETSIDTEIARAGSGATAARFRLRGFYTASPSDPPTDQADIIILDDGVNTLLRVRYNDAGTVKMGDLVLV